MLYSGCRSGVAIVAIDLQAIDSPISGLERLRVVLDVILTGRRFAGASAILAPDGPRPVTTEGGIEDDIIILEVIINIAARATLEGSSSCSPSRRIRIGACGAVGDAIAAEEPDVDGGAGPFHGVDATLGVVETVAERGGTAGLDAAALAALAVLVEHGAAVAGVHGHGILGLVVDAFDDVDFAAVRPVGTLY